MRTVDSRSREQVTALTHLLNKLRESQGLSQEKVAKKLGVLPQYLSDVKRGRKTLTHSFACKIGEILGRQAALGLRIGPLAGRLINQSENPAEAVIGTLPVLPCLFVGSPEACREWDGSEVQLSTVAARLAAQAKQPYVLRMESNDQCGRLCIGDLVLIDQKPDEKAGCHVVEADAGLVFARSKGKSKFVEITTGGMVAGKTTIVGHVAAIVFGRM